MGDWSLADVACGQFGSFEPFFERFDGASLSMTGTPTGCVAQVSLESAECGATERWTITLDEVDAATGDLESSGILSCAPSGCRFDGSTSCLPGAGAGAGDVRIESGDDELRIVGAFGAASEGIECPLGLEATFVAVP